MPPVVEVDLFAVISGVAIVVVAEQRAGGGRGGGEHSAARRITAVAASLSPFMMVVGRG